MATKQELLNSLDEFTWGYVDALLWSTNDESREDGGDPLDKNYSATDFTVESLVKILMDCQKFEDFMASKDWGGELTPAKAGHYYWLSREGHGTGFFDSDAEHSDELQAAAEATGQRYIEVYAGKLHYR